MLIVPKDDIHVPTDDDELVYPYLTIGRPYVVVSMYYNEKARIVSDGGSPVMVPISRVCVDDDWRPSDWVVELDEEGGAYYWGPAECRRRGFFERWHDGFVEERIVFRRVYEKLVEHYAEQERGPFTAVLGPGER